LPGLVNLLASEANVFGSRQNLPLWKVCGLALSGYFAAFLRRVVLVGEASPGGCFDGGSVGLRSAHLLQSTRQLFCEVFYRL
jgi:hypothetical protein